MDSPKYNRTFHLPWSKGATNDDKIATDLSYLINGEIVITEKMDGSNTSLETNGCFARTHSGPPTHISFDGLKAFHSTIRHKISKGTQLFGEWLYAKHSISYDALPHHFMLFNVRELKGQDTKSWNEVCYWESWEMVRTWAAELEIPTVPELYTGKVSSEKELKELVESLMIQPSVCGGIREGVVVRIQEQFTDTVFQHCVMKYVRANHVQTSEHWKDQEIVKNKLKL
jgi:hypothetical protein